MLSGTKNSVYGYTLQVLGYGCTQQILRHGYTQQILGYGHTLQILGYGHTLQILGYGHTLQVEKQWVWLHTAKTRAWIYTAKIGGYTLQRKGSATYRCLSLTRLENTLDGSDDKTFLARFLQKDKVEHDIATILPTPALLYLLITR